MVDLPTLTPKKWPRQLPLRLVHPSERHFCPGENGSEMVVGWVDVTKVQNSRRCFHKWMVYKGKPMKIDDLGVSPL